MTFRLGAVVLLASVWGCTPPEMTVVSAPGAERPEPPTPEGQEFETLGETGARVGSSVREKSRQAAVPRVP